MNNSAISLDFECHGGITYKEGVAAVTADHSHPLRLDGQCRLSGLLLWDNHHWAQVDYPSAVEGTKRDGQPYKSNLSKTGLVTSMMSLDWSHKTVT